MDSWRFSAVIELLEEAGRLALSMSDSPAGELKADRSIVTAADKAVEKLLSCRFDRPDAGIFMIGEETVSCRSREYVSAALKGSSWIVDPIDGTAPFAHNIPLWGISVGFMHGGFLKEGAIFLPALGEMIASRSGETLYASCGPDPARWSFPSSLRPLSKPSMPFDDSGIVSLSQSMSKQGHYKGANPVQALCSCVYSMASLMKGRHIGYILSAKIWDVAGSLPALKNLGFAGRLNGGADLMSLEVDPSRYVLEPSSKHAWSLNGTAVFAQDEAALSEIVRLSEFPS